MRICNSELFACALFLIFRIVLSRRFPAFLRTGFDLDYVCSVYLIFNFGCDWLIAKHGIVFPLGVYRK